MLNKLIRYFKHPIWSNVFAALIVLSLTASYNFFISVFNKTNFKTEFVNFWSYELKLWFVILLLIICYLVFLLSKKFRKRKNAFEYDIETLQLDKDVFDKIRCDIISDKVARNLKRNRFSSHQFDISDIDFIEDFFEYTDNPNFEFINPELEILKLELLRSIDYLDKSLGKNVFGTNISHPRTCFIGIPKEWEFDKYKNAQSEIMRNEKLTYLNFENLIKTGRRVLKI